MSKFVFSSDHLPADLSPYERAGLWVESMRALGASFDLDISKSGNFRGQVEVLPLGPVHVGTAKAISTTSVRVYRPTRLIAKDNDDRAQIVFNMTDDPLCCRQFGREVILNRGDATILAMGDQSETSSKESGKTASVLLPLSLIPSGVAIEDLAARPLGGDAEAQRLLCAHTNNLLSTQSPLIPDVAALAADYLTGLVGILVGGPREARTDSAQRAVAAARLAAVRTAMIQRFREPGLNAGAVGTGLGLSSRYIQHLFQQNGSTFTSELLTMRLDAARVALSHGSLERASLIDIAFRCGFSDLSTFYRAFKRRFGTSPGDFRSR